MADQPDRSPHLRITRSSIVVQDPNAEAPRRFAREIDCGASGASGEDRDASDGSNARGKSMPSRYGDDNGRRHR